VGWLQNFFGFGNGQGNSSHYLFWSGAGSDLAYVAVVWAVFRRLNCHQPRCWRLGRFPVEGTLMHACRRHHPSPPGPGSIRKRYHLYAGKQIGDG
jgi:hypothetical protein